MNIGIDCRCLQAGDYTGIPGALWSMLPFLAASPHHFVLFVNWWGRIPPQGVLRLREFVLQYQNVSLVEHRWPNKILHASMLLFRRPRIDRLLGDVDVLWFPNIHIAAFSASCPIVQTLHDLSFVHLPEFYSWRRRLWHIATRLPQVLVRSHHIIVPSYFTKRDVVASYLCPPEKIDVIPHGAPMLRECTDELQHEFLTRHCLRSGYILAVGSFEQRKNLESLLQAYCVLRQSHDVSVPQLVLAGFSGWGQQQLFSRLRKLGIEQHVVVLSDFLEEDKQELFQCASVFVYPSLFEGFGLPVLEAMTFGVPVIASATSSLFEIVGNAGILLDAGRPSDIAAALHQVLTSSSFRDLLVERGQHRVSVYSWKKSAQQLLQVLLLVTSEG